MLFSIGADPLVKLVSAIPGIIWSPWYLDDGSIVAPVSVIPDASNAVTTHWPAYGLHLNLGKCSSTVHGISQALLQRCGVPNVPSHSLAEGQGTCLLANPLGTEDFVKGFVSDTVLKVQSFTDKLGDLHNPQVALYLLRHSLGIARVTHMLRCIDPTVIKPQIDGFDAVLFSALGQICADDISADAWIQARLPIRMGGLGLTHARSVSASAYAASFLTFVDSRDVIGFPWQIHPPVGFQNSANMLTNLTGGTIPVTKSWCTTDSTPSSGVSDHRFQHRWHHTSSPKPG